MIFRAIRLVVESVGDDDGGDGFQSVTSGIAYSIGPTTNDTIGWTVAHIGVPIDCRVDGKDATELTPKGIIPSPRLSSG